MLRIHLEAYSIPEYLKLNNRAITKLSGLETLNFINKFWR